MVSKHDHAMQIMLKDLIRLVSLCSMKWPGQLPLPLKQMLGHRSINPAPIICTIVFINSLPAQNGKGTVIGKYIVSPAQLRIGLIFN